MDEFFRINKLLMIPSGLWPFPANNSAENKKKIKMMLFIIAHIIISTGQLTAIFKNTYTLLETAEEICMLNISLMNIVKLSGFLLQRKTFRDILTDFDKLFKNTPMSQDDKYIKEVTELWQYRAHLLAKLNITLFFTATTSYNIIPIIYYLNNGKLVLITDVEFYIDLIGDLKKYIIAYIIMSALFISNAFVLASMDSLFGVTILFLYTRIDILKYCINNATDEAVEQFKQSKLFEKCIEYHKIILRATELFEWLFSPILLFQFFSSLMIICISLYITKQPHTGGVKQIILGFFFIAASLQLCIFCFFGQLLQSKFETLNFEALYSSWYNAPIEYQKNILFYIMCTSKTVTLTAYKIMPVNLASYMTICKTAMSYLALLQGMDENNTKT